MNFDIATSNTYLYSGHEDKSIQIWSLKKHVRVREIKNVHDTGILNVCLSGDEKMLITRAQDNIIKLIDIKMCRVIKSFSNIELYMD